MRLHLFIVLFLLLSVACQRQDGQTIVIENVKGYTFYNDELTQFSSIAISGGRVVDIATDGTLEIDDPDVRRIDGRGNIMLPGLIDAHGHVMGLGYQEMDVDVAGIRSKEETLDKIRAHAEANPDLEWVRGRGWNQVLWPENEFPTAADLDKAVPDRPVWMRRVDGHAGWANTRALELAGISQDTPDPQGGRIIRDTRNRATGVFIDAAMNYITREIPERSAEEQERALELAMQQMSKHGLISVHDAGIGVDEWNLYKKFADEDRLITRIYAMIRGTGSAFDELSAGGPIESYADDKLALRSVKISADGALGSRGAALLEDYLDEPGNNGLLFYSQEELNGMIMKGVSNGYQMNIHAIGDAANRQVLNAFELAREKFGDQGLRHRIEHAQVVRLDDIPRFAELDIIASMQQTHATSDMNMAEDRVGPERIKGAYVWQKFLDQGTLIAGGSDFPVEHVNPFYGLYSGITRQDHEGNPPGGWYPEEAMSRREAFRSFTIDAARAAHQEEVLGSLEPGKWADFILIDRDIFEVPAIEIWQAEVLETWVGGEKVYSKN